MRKFHYKNIEALACGSIESVTSETGLIVEKGNIDGLLNAIHNYWCPLNLKLHFPVRYYSGQPIPRMYSHAS